MVTNYFVTADTAARYARARPGLNVEFNARLIEHTGRVARAIDIGCGTGISSRALSAVAHEVHGIDPSWAMLSEALPDQTVSYCIGTAEQLPYATRSFDLAAVGLAIHWLDRQPFLEETARVLRQDGWLFIADTWLGGIMRGAPDFSDWIGGTYLNKYPTPARNREPITDAGVAPFGFVIRDRWQIEREVWMSCESLATYLTTQSNVTAGLAQTGESLESATDWLLQELSHYFSRGDRAMSFGGAATLLRYTAAEQELAGDRRPAFQAAVEPARPPAPEA